ncbi:MAG: acetyl-CoA C-acyltransferase [Nitrososphaerota archaeon]
MNVKEEREAYIVSAARTPIGVLLGSLRGLSAAKLGGIAIQAALKRAGLEGKEVQGVVMGNVLQAGLGQNPARQAAYYAGLPESVNAYTVNLVCASGMMAIANAHNEIRLGYRDVMVAGGMESMSNAPFLLSAELRSGLRFLYQLRVPLVDAMTWDGLIDFRSGRSMGEIAERLARERGLSRRELDEFAYLSNLRAAEAWDEGLFAEEVVPVELEAQGQRKQVTQDEGIRRDTSLEKLLQLRPAFPGGDLVTAGNSPKLSDGACALVLASGRAVKERGLKPLARILGYSWGALDLENFPEAPIPVTRSLLERLRLRIEDFDLIEHNEAFAVSSLLVLKGLGISIDRYNVNGGAIALGHPLGCSGARIVATLLYALKARGLRRGLATICHGGGGAMSLALELL